MISNPKHMYLWMRQDKLLLFGSEFKEIAAAVRARDTLISFDELHDKLVEHEAFLKRDELRSTGNLGNITANAAPFSSSNNGNHNDNRKKIFQNNRNIQAKTLSFPSKAPIAILS
ncbi:hypothetical protein JRO89_XS04G0252900 [Xanthoceras sorbifolium]|uniref:Uncharacterized protein n=1 Tax=Xanthoceras sorbifolium TaxID=99658 RepID=A0ABQ8I703_9ROSI|nr:hypothetical protein JRO89_XS04G0252900 [Xanthoceras sorbifolium]